MATAQREQYVYAPLSTPSSIRLIQRLGRHSDGLVHISLTEVDLNTPPVPSPYHVPRPAHRCRPFYHCLSYTWGNPHANGVGFEDSFRYHDSLYGPEQLFEIVCDGKSMKVRKNLYDFLQQPPTNDHYQGQAQVDPRTGRIRLHENATGDAAHLHMCVGQGSPLDVQDNLGRTPLHYAAEAGLLENVMILIKGNASLHIRELNGKRPEDLAKGSGHEKVALTLEVCRKHGAEWLTKKVPPFVHESPDNYIWIDSICIDQNNLRERTQQVKIMNVVFSLAHYVLVWLGEADGYIHDAVSVLSRLRHYGGQYANCELPPFRSHQPDQYAKFSLPPISLEEWNALAALFLRQWFKRIWAIQEIVLPEYVVMYCGNTNVMWEELTNASQVLATWFQNNGWMPSTIYSPSGGILVPIEHFVRCMDVLRRTVHSKTMASNSKLQASLSLEKLVLSNVPCMCTDPKDKIYALFPLSLLNKQQKSRLEPDYSISTAQCYTDCTKTIIVESDNLEVLSYVHDNKIRQVQGLPSWVPDFSLHGINPLLHKNFVGSNGIDEESKLLQQPLRNELHIEAMRLDSVVTAVSDIMKANIYVSKYKFNPGWFELLRMLPKLSEAQMGKQSRGEVLWRTLCADTDDKTERPAPESFGPMCKEFLCAMICSQPYCELREVLNAGEGAVSTPSLVAEYTEPSTSRAHDPTASVCTEQAVEQHRNSTSQYLDCHRSAIETLLDIKNEADEPFLPDMHELEMYLASMDAPIYDSKVSSHIIPSDIVPFVFSFEAAIGGRRLFATRSGRLGTGSVSFEDGDTIWLIPGYNLPIILRPCTTEHEGQEQTRHHFIGAAYVHGVMRDDRVKYLDTNKLEKVVLI